MLEDLQTKMEGHRVETPALAKWDFSVGLHRGVVDGGDAGEDGGDDAVEDAGRAGGLPQHSQILDQVDDRGGPRLRTQLVNDEISLEEGDVVEDLQDLGDGWTQGRNARTGEVGLFRRPTQRGCYRRTPAKTVRTTLQGKMRAERSPRPPSTVKYQDQSTIEVASSVRRNDNDDQPRGSDCSRICKIWVTAGHRVETPALAKWDFSVGLHRGVAGWRRPCA